VPLDAAPRAGIVASLAPEVRLRHLLLAASLSLSALTTAHAQVVALPAIADATTDSNQPNANLGAAPRLDFGKTFTYTPSFTVWFLRGHVQFDLTSVAGLGAPQRARLFWYQSSAGAAGCLPVELFRVTAPWSETTITWATQPPHATPAVASACVGDSFALGWKEFDVTTLVQGWLAGTFPNHGMVVRDPSESSAGAARPGFGESRESVTTSLRPYLELEYATTFGSACMPAPTAGAPTLQFWSGAPRLGTSFTLRAGNLVPGGLHGAIAGLSNTTWSGNPLPLSLAAIGWNGCWLNVAPDAVVAFGLAPAADYSIVWPVPNDQALIGLAVFAQSWAFDLAGAPLLSNGIGTVVYGS
jgi:hypothetical protein